MNYSLAKQLKDGKFPQTFPHSDKFFSAEGKLVETVRAKNNEWALTEFTSGCAVPPLEDLIAMCQAFGGVFALHGPNNILPEWQGWTATIIKEGMSRIARGTTPDEAVALLCLELLKI